MIQDNLFIFAREVVVVSRLGVCCIILFVWAAVQHYKCYICVVHRVMLCACELWNWFSHVIDVLVKDIGLYRDVWIAAIASSRTRLATLTGAMCKTSQCKLRSLRVNSGMLNVIRIVTYYTLPPLESPDSFWIAMAISR